MILDAASSGDGKFYLLPGFGNFDGRATVIELDDSAVEQRVLAVPLPRFPELVRGVNPEGWLWPSRIQVDGDFLYVYDSLGGLASFRR